MLAVACVAIDFVVAFEAICYPPISKGCAVVHVSLRGLAIVDKYIGRKDVLQRHFCRIMTVATSCDPAVQIVTKSVANNLQLPQVSATIMKRLAGIKANIGPNYTPYCSQRARRHCYTGLCHFRYWNMCC